MLLFLTSYLSYVVNFNNLFEYPVVSHSAKYIRFRQLHKSLLSLYLMSIVYLVYEGPTLYVSCILSKYLSIIAYDSYVNLVMKIVQG